MTQVVLHTAGNGLWSDEKRAVSIVNMVLGRGVELMVYFDIETWNVEEHGLIYTDRLFLRELQEFLDLHGLPGKDVDYSEQGMQGDNYVSLDVGIQFAKVWAKKFEIDPEDLMYPDSDPLWDFN